MVGRKIKNVILFHFYNTIIPAVPLEGLPICTRTKETISFSDSMYLDTSSY